jgi:hypothetical protein
MGGGGTGFLDLSSLYIEMRPYMDRSPFTVRRDCSASRVHQVRVAFRLCQLGCWFTLCMSVVTSLAATAGCRPLCLLQPLLCV